eukprot:m.338498 g.338498  ORF g.338498 m.338498 type:complete len:468 (-) comp18445_c0_seq1:312-1715(-)
MEDPVTPSDARLWQKVRQKSPTKQHKEKPSAVNESSAQKEFENKKMQWAQIMVFCLTYAMYSSMYFSRKPFSVVKGMMAKDLNLTTSDLGNVDTSFLAFYAVGQFTLPQLGERLGARRMLTLIGLTACIASAIFSSTSSVIVFLLFNGLSGYMQSAAFPLCMKALAPWFPARVRGRVLGLWTTCQQIGGVLSTSFAGYVAVTYDWETTFFYSAIPILIMTVALWILLIERPEDIGLTSPAAGSKKTIENEAEQKVASFWEVLNIEGIRPLGASYFCIKLVRYTLMFWLPFYMAQAHGLDAAQAAYMSTLFDIGGIFGSLLCGYLSDTVFPGRRLLVSVGMSIGCALALLSFGVLPGMSGFTLGLMLLLIGIMVAGPDSVLGGASTQDMCERSGTSDTALSTACGITNGMGSLGSMIQGPLSAFLVDAFGWNGLFIALGCVCIAGAMAVLPLGLQIERDRQKEKLKSG